ncbi:MAG: helicase-exonuclease AddAB subunit AddA [Clostridia bacterium]|nr:helicase-exonuclease AddAB subunit AddA [Clostridia bacterium]
MSDVTWTPAQRDAIDSKGYSVAVSAAAGSGKTAVLTRRIIERVCAEDGDISRVLVVTFTKAAAAELVSRIADALSKKLAENPENAHIRKQSLLVSSAHISTIHSFCLDLIRTNFQKLNIPPDFSAGDETEIRLMMNGIAEELISDYFEGELAQDEEKIEDFGKFADMFGDITRSEKLPQTLISLYLNISSTVDSLERIEYFREISEKAVREGFDGSPWELCLREYLTEFLLHYEKIYEDAVMYARCDKKFAKPLAVIADEWNMIERVRTSAQKGVSYEKLAALLCEMKFARLTGVAGDANLSAFSDFRKEFKDELKKVIKDYYSYSAEALQSCFSETAEAMKNLGIFMRVFEKRFDEEKRRRKLITFGDMERYALRLLYDRKNDAPTELALALREAYDEIYIDEYQDTNELQDLIFRLISKENNRFNVGDIKQSIYAFRGAKPEIFSKLLASRPKYGKGCDEKAVKIFLSENFRSSVEILEFCNGIFEKLMNVKEIRYGEDERLHPGRDLHTALPELYLIPKASSGTKKQTDDEEEEPEDMLGEADFVAQKISELLKNGTRKDGTPIKPSDIVILLRSTASSAKAYEDALQSRGIPYKNSGDKEFFESAEVLLVISLLSAIDNPERDIYLAAALKSPIYGVTLDELMFIRRFCKEGSLFYALRAFTEETDFAKGKKFLADYEKYALLASETPCDALIWQIYNDTGIFSVLSADENLSVYEIEQANANLMTLYNYARGFERGGFKGLSGFISFINEVLANRAQMDISGFTSPGEVVRIMTVHKSKGLEFPVCFLCSLGKKLNFKEAKEKTVYHDDFGISLKLTANQGMVRLETPLRKATLLDKKRAMIEEELRILYVALTRPKEYLYLTATVPMKKIEEGRFALGGTEGFYDRKSKYFSPYALWESSNYLDLLMTAIADRPSSVKIDTAQPPVSEETQTEVTVKEEAQTPVPEAEDMTYFEAKKLVHAHLDYVYPYRRLTEVPSKLSVSKLYPNILDSAEEGKDISGEAPTVLKMPNFLMREEDEEITAAQKGTAMHTFMQFCNFERVMKNGAEAEIEYLAKNRFIFESDREKMDVRKLNAFFESALARKMMSAEKIFREKRFMIKLPAALFTEESNDILTQEKILVQGVIDCAFFDENGELILVDYKTDFFPRGMGRAQIEKTLRERHGQQLGYYKLACKTLFGVSPAHTFIYSFALNDTVEIDHSYVC